MRSLISAMIGVAKAGGIVAYADYGVLFHLVINTLIPISVRFHVFHILMAPPPLIFQAIAI
jgi:hypothetical protein